MAAFQDGRHREPVQHFNKIEISVPSGNVELYARHKEGTNRRAAIASRTGPPYVIMNRTAARRFQFVIMATTACVLHVDTFPLADTDPSIRLIDDTQTASPTSNSLGNCPSPLLHSLPSLYIASHRPHCRSRPRRPPHITSPPAPWPVPRP